MPNDKNRLLSKIGEILTADGAGSGGETLLYAAVDNNYVAPSIFENHETQIVYRDPDMDSLSPVLLELWQAEDPSNRWEEIEYVLHSGTFEATFTYPDEIDPDEGMIDRGHRIATEHFGDKPIRYPPADLDQNPPQFKL